MGHQVDKEKKQPPSNKDTNSRPNWLKVDKATTLLRSGSKRATKEEPTKVTRDKTKRREWWSINNRGSNFKTEKHSSSNQSRGMNQSTNRSRVTYSLRESPTKWVLSSLGERRQQEQH